MFSVNDFFGSSSLVSIAFSYTDEYSDEKLAEEYEKSDFENAETDDDFAEFDDSDEFFVDDEE
ncbi:MAG: hypothetical protein KBT21_02580 [Treponema sp.]|nr:hypothetical protein [Candidatus Treponema merdequi]